MMLKVCLVIAASISLVSCMQVMGNNPRKSVDTMKIVENGSGDMMKGVGKWFGDMMKTIEKGATNTAKIVGKWAGDTVKTSENSNAHTVEIVGKWAGDTMKSTEKGATHVMKIGEKWAGNTTETVEKSGAGTMKVVGKWAGDATKTIGNSGAHTVKIVEKGAANTLKIVEKGAADTMKTAEDLIYILETVETNSSCACVNYTCGCCLQIVVEKISLNETGCLNISYLPDEYGFQLVFTLNGIVIISEKVSVKNPPPICATVPYVHQLASLCIRFYNLDYKAKQFSGCADIEIEVERIVVKKYDLGCIHIPPGYVHFFTKAISP